MTCVGRSYASFTKVPMRPKGKANQVMWAYYEGSDLDSSKHHDEVEGEQEANSVEKKEALELHLVEIRLSSIQREGSFRLRGVLAGQKVISLLDTCATHNFIDAQFVERHGLITKEFKGLRVKVANGYTLRCDRMV